jgi:hypothetical protein
VAGCEEGARQNARSKIKHIEDLDISRLLDLGNEIKLDLAGELPDETDPASQPAPDPPIDDRIVEGKWGDPATT